MLEYAGQVAHQLFNAESRAEAEVLAAAIAIHDGVQEFEGREALHYENLMAHAVMSGYAADNGSDILRKLSEKAWHRVQSSVGMRNAFLQDFRLEDDHITSINQIRMIAINASYERRRANAMTLDEAAGLIRNQVEALKQEYPELGLSFGYIGNCDLGVGPKYDDRSWMVFTRHRKPESPGQSITFGGYPSEKLGIMAIEAEKGLAAWCATQYEKLGFHKETNQA